MQEASCLGCHCLPKVASSEVSFFFLTFGDAARQATPTLPPHALARAAGSQCWVPTGFSHMKNLLLLTFVVFTSHLSLFPLWYFLLSIQFCKTSVSEFPKSIHNHIGCHKIKNPTPFQVGVLQTYYKTRKKQAPAKWFSWLEHRPVHWKVTGSIPSWGICLGCGFNPQSGQVQEAAHQCFPFTSMGVPRSPCTSLLNEIKEIKKWKRIHLWAVIRTNAPWNTAWEIIQQHWNNLVAVESLLNSLQLFKTKGENCIMI